jgi:hypothetical protein
MSTSAISPIASIDFGSSSATAPEQAVFNSLLNQLQQSVGLGDLTTSQTLLNAIDALSPSSATGSNPLGAFLTSLTTALNDGSVSQAQGALSTYQSATPATTPSSPSTPAADPGAVAAQIAASLIQSQNQLLLVNALDGPNSALGSTSTSSSSNSASSLIGILNAAYGSSSGSSSSSTANTSGTEAATSTTPYDTLVSSIQASLAAGNGTITPALAYLQAAGNFVNTSA